MNWAVSVASECGKPLDLKFAIEREEAEKEEKQNTKAKLEELEKNQQKILEDLEFFKQKNNI